MAGPVFKKGKYLSLFAVADSRTNDPFMYIQHVSIKEKRINQEFFPKSKNQLQNPPITHIIR